MEVSVLVLEKEGGLWSPFLKDYFADAPVSVITAPEPIQALAVFDKVLPCVLFTGRDFLTKVFLQKIKVRKNTDPAFRVYLLGDLPEGVQRSFFDAVFPAVPEAADFNKHFVETLPVPESIRLLVVDDEEEVATVVRDFFEGRRVPSFEIESAMNGQKALAAIAARKPDAIILDIKMPVMDGREFYAAFKKEKLVIPVIVFFDSVSGEELAEMRKFGNPAMVEKGYQGSSLLSLMYLVKKLVYFSAMDQALRKNP
jgi:CheY-like chemotaxis protein